MSLQEEEERQMLLSGTLNPLASRIFVRDRAVLVVMLVQLSFCAIAWTFAGFMMRKTIPLPDSQAELVQNNPSDTQIIVTLLSTLLALIGSSLLGKAVQYALVRRLACRPLRIATIVDWVKISQRSLSLNGRPRWTLLSIAWASLLGFLTTAWLTLLAPRNVSIYYDFQGEEVDFLTISISSIGNVYQPPPGFTLSPDVAVPYLYLGADIDVVAALSNAGVAMASGVTNFIPIPATNYVCNTSTGGIYPGSKVLSSLPKYDLPIDGVENPLYVGQTRTYNATQQGFAADVSCRTSTLNDPVMTSNVTNSFQITKSDSEYVAGYSIDTYNWKTNCSSDVQYSTVGVPVLNTLFPSGEQPATDINMLLMSSVCFNQNFTGPSNQSFLVIFSTISNSGYKYFNQTCQVTPLVTSVQAIYDENSVINVIQPPLYQHTLPDPIYARNTSALMWYTATLIWIAFVQSQGLTGNSIGSQLVALDPENFASAIESVLRGMVEYVGTLMGNIGANISVTSAPEKSTPEKLVHFNGTVIAQTPGWTFQLRTHGPSLAVITLVTVLTVIAGVFAILQVNSFHEANRTQSPQASSSVYAFNPTDMMDLFLAASMGDLSRVLSKFGDRPFVSPEVSNSNDVLRIVLGTTGDGWPALRAVGRDGTDLDGTVYADGDSSGSSSLSDWVWGAGRKDNGSSGGGYIELGEMGTTVEK